MNCLKYKIEIVHDAVHQWKEIIDEVMFDLGNDRYLNINKYAMFSHNGKFSDRAGMNPEEVEVSILDENKLERLFFLTRSNQEISNTLDSYQKKIARHIFENNPYEEENMELFDDALPKIMVSNHLLRYPIAGYFCEYCGKKLEKDQVYIVESPYLKLPRCKTCYDLYKGNHKYDIIGKSKQEAIEYLNSIGVSWVLRDQNDLLDTPDKTIGIVVENGIVIFYGDKDEK